MLKLETKFSNLPKVLIAFVFLTAFFFLAVQESYGQTPVRTYLKGQKTGDRTTVDLIPLGTGTAGITGDINTHDIFLLGFQFYYAPTDYLNDSPIQKITLKASQDLGVLGALGAGGNTYIQFRNTNNSILSAGITTFFKIGGQPTAKGLSLDVTGLLGITNGTSVFGEAYINASNYNLSSSSPNEGTKTGSTTTHILIDELGEYYAAVTPNSNYNSVRLHVQLPRSLRVVDVARSVEVDVYNAFYESSGGVCSVLPRYTSPPEVDGIALITGVLGLNLGDLINDPQNALNENDSQYASYSSGTLSLSVASTISQTLFFDHKASNNDSFYAKFSLNTSSISLDLLNFDGITFTALNGDNEVWTGSLSSIASLLGLNLLDLITIGGSNHTPIEITAKPGVEFDRIRISYNQGLISLGVLGDAFRLYNVKLMPEAPSILDANGNPTDEIICNTESATFSVNASGSGSLNYQWQYFNGTNWVPAEGVNNQASYTISNVPLSYNGRLYRVEISGGNSSCPQSIISKSAELKVLASPGKPELTLTPINNN